MGYRGGTSRVVAIVGSGHRAAAAALGLTQSAGSTDKKTIIVVVASSPELAQFDQCGEVREAVRQAGLSVELHLVTGDTDAITIEDAYHLGLSPGGSGICIPNGAVLELNNHKSVPADHVIWCCDSQPQCSQTPRTVRDVGDSSRESLVGEECTVDPGSPAKGAWLWDLRDNRGKPTVCNEKETWLRGLGEKVAKGVINDLSATGGQSSRVPEKQNAKVAKLPYASRSRL